MRIWRPILILATAISFGGPVSAAIVKIQDAKSCQVTGLDTDTSSVRGGVHCADGDVGFSLMDLLVGEIGLLVGDSQTPSWNIWNDTGAVVTELPLWYSGALAENAQIDMQVSGDFFSSCSSDDSLAVNVDASCGSGDKTVKPEDGGLLPVLLTWSGSDGIGIGAMFNIGTASFAHSGEDAGCISGTADCRPTVIPLPASALFLLTALGALWFARRRRLAI